MAKLLYTTEDFYTDPSSFPLLSEVMIGSVYNPTTTSYNITLRTTPFCFYIVQDESLELLIENISIKDNAWQYDVSNGNLSTNTLVCTTIPVIWQTTELLIHNDDIDNIKVAPESVVNAMYNVESPDCDGDPTFCVDVEEVEAFCAIMTTPWTWGESIPACIVQQKTGTIALTDVTLTTQEKENIFEWFDDILISILMLVFMVFFAVFVKKLLSYFWR